MSTVMYQFWRSRKFWLMVIATIQTIVFGQWPDFPVEVWGAIDVLLMWLVAMIAVEDAALKRAGIVTVKENGKTTLMNASNLSVIRADGTFEG